MKKHIVALLGLLMSAGAWADCQQDGQVAVAFINQYVAYVQAGMSGQPQPALKPWLQANPLVHADFVRHWQATEEEGRRDDPEMGWGADIILDAQDFPDRGFRLLRCSPTPGYVRLQGAEKGTESYRVTVRLAPATIPGSTPTVVGAGIVNVPEAERAWKWIGTSR